MRFVMIIAGCLVLNACSTSSEATQQAQHTASLIGELRQSIDDFHRQQRLVTYITTESLIQQEQNIAKANTRSVIDPTVRRATGDVDGFVIADALNAAADAVALRSVKDPVLMARITSIAAATSSFPANDESLVMTQRAALTMSEELSMKTRWNEYYAFVQTVRNGVNSNRDSMKKASDEIVQAANVAQVPK